jgi:hypothetical protein
MSSNPRSAEQILGQAEAPFRTAETLPVTVPGLSPINGFQVYNVASTPLSPVIDDLLFVGSNALRGPPKGGEELVYVTPRHCRRAE